MFVEKTQILKTDCRMMETEKEKFNLCFELKFLFLAMIQ